MRWIKPLVYLRGAGEGEISTGEIRNVNAKVERHMLALLCNGVYASRRHTHAR
jgi:hypothetical protein